MTNTTNQRQATVNTETMLQAVAVLATIKGRDFSVMTGEGNEYTKPRNGGLTVEQRQVDAANKSGSTTEYRLARVANGRLVPVVEGDDFGSKADVFNRVVGLVQGIEYANEKATSVRKEMFVEAGETYTRPSTSKRNKGVMVTGKLPNTLGGDYVAPDIRPVVEAPSEGVMEQVEEQTQEQELADA